MKPICDIVYKGCKWTMAIFGIFMLAVITIGIFSRYFIKRPIIWEYEACIALFIWCTFLGAATCFRDKQHISFAMLTEALPESIRKVIMVFKNLLVVAILGLGVIYGFKVVESTYFIEYQTIPFSQGFSYAALPVGFLASLLFVIEGIASRGITKD